MVAAPTTRTRELEKLLATIRNASMIQLDYDGWDRWGSAHATPEQRASMNADFAAATARHTSATAALEALVVATRADAPGELEAWMDAHDAYLAAFLEECAAGGESARTAAFVAGNERREWAEARAGSRPFVNENVAYVTMNSERYRRLFGIDPQTLEDV